jgi:hypothetical protein
MYKVFGKLTLERLEALEPGVFTQGTVSDNPVGVHMSGSDRLLRWVAVKGGSKYGWKIYIHWAESDWDFVRSNGDKVTGDHNIKKLVECDDAAFAEYEY